MGKSKSTLHGRDADSGKFTTIQEARQKPKTHVVERVPKPGFGESKTPTKTILHGRDADTGKFTTVEEAREKPKTHVVERVPKPGFGDT
jgi:hypothetical protein